MTLFDSVMGIYKRSPYLVLTELYSSRLERDLYSRKDKEGIEIREWLKADIRLGLQLSTYFSLGRKFLGLAWIVGWTLKLSHISPTPDQTFPYSREAMVGTETFQPKHVLIATWKNVSFAGGIPTARQIYFS